MVAPVFRELAFVWACVALMGGCALAALVVRQRKFLLGLSEQFVKMPPSTKAVIVTAVVIATVFAQKPGNVATNQHESARIEVVMPAVPNTEKTEVGRHGEGVERDAPTVASETPANPPCLSNSVTSALSDSNPPVVSSNDVVRSYRLETVQTNESVSYARPANARLVGTWHLTDAYRGRVKVELPRSPHFSTFPLFHPSTSCWAHTWGKVRPQLRNASNEIFVIGAPMFARHDLSYLWTAATTNGSVLLTWENFFLGNPYERLATNLHESTRISIRENSCQFVDHPPVNAQLELFPNGDFVARSNAVERIYRRVNPDDWDDDGIPNVEDDAPLVPSDAPQFGPHQTLPEGANAEAYCWIDLVVRRANAKVTFAGDGASNLADPSFIAEADATNRVTLLIGKTYRVTCPMPFEVAGKSSDDIEESWERNGAALWLHWPVSIRSHGTSVQSSVSHTETRRHGAATTDWHGLTRIGNDLFSTFVQTYAAGPSRSFTMQVIPSGIGGAFTWTNVCCRVSGSGYTFTVTCGDDCSCGGCSATGYLEYEGYRLPAYGGYCGCSGSIDHPGGEEDPDEKPPLPGAAATFSKRVVFFEDEYENAPGETVPWQSTETRLDCWAYGGTRGGHVRIEIKGADGLVQYGGSPLPFEQDLEPGEEVTFKNTYRAVRPSGGKDAIVVTATFTENETGWTETTVDKATAVKVTISPQLDAPENDSRYRHKFGIGEVVDCILTPASASVSWECSSGSFSSMSGKASYTAPLHSAVNSFKAVGGDSEFAPQTSVVAPQGVIARDVGYRVCDASAGQAGGICLTMTLHAIPLDVSFLGVKIEEVPDVGGSHSGYFADTFFMSEWLHGVAQKAGTWLEPYGDNAFLNDEAGFIRALPQLDENGFVSDEGTKGWKSGNLTWSVPCGWASSDVQDGDDPVGVFAQEAKQVMDIDANGNCEVRKHANRVRRNVDDTVFLNGVQVK